MPVPKGTRVGGRKKGVPNKHTRDLQELLDKMGHDPKEAMILIAKGDMPCNTCRGKGKTKYKISGTDRIADRLCESCFGSLMEKLSPALIYNANAELLNYLLPKRKAIEHTGPEGSPIEVNVSYREQILSRIASIVATGTKG